MGDMLLRWLTWRLPNRIVHWAIMRAWINATCDEYGDTEIPSLTVALMLDRWDVRK